MQGGGGLIFIFLIFLQYQQKEEETGMLDKMYAPVFYIKTNFLAIFGIYMKGKFNHIKQTREGRRNKKENVSV